MSNPKLKKKINMKYFKNSLYKKGVVHVHHMNT
jgi:hypothetical protein